ncbi:MAG: DUF4091 domain-containing protein [Clostridia bacterium]|nr:DUF4091 domain-containing protein [Clostridia bacterium]
MKTLLLSSLSKVFKDTEPNEKEFSSFSALKNEHFSFQLAILPEADSEAEVSVELSSALKDNITIYEVKNIPAGTTQYEDSDDFHYPADIKEFPDLLKPVNGKITLTKGEWSALWLEYKPTEGVIGQQEIAIKLSAGNTVCERVFTLNLIDAELPKQDILFTNWFHNDCLCTYYNVEACSEEYWAIAERFIKNAREHGVNMLLTPVFTPPLDTAVGGERPTFQLVGVKKHGEEYAFDFTNFRKYVEICLKNGIEAFEISHFFTQWGAEHAPKVMAEVDGEIKRIFGWETEAAGEEYTNFLAQFSVALRAETEALGIKERCWVHVSDEPNEKQIEQYTRAADIVKKYFSDFNSLDALSDIEYFRNGLIKTPVCAEDEADIFRAEVKDFWTYYCCSQTKKNLPNRMFAQPSARNRVLGVLLYKYNARGFLQWGHNFWYAQYSKHPIDPFKVTDAGGGFPSGDSHVVYPGEGGVPLNSLRHLVFADAFQDLRALRLLEALTSRDYVLRLIEKGLDIPLSFTTYPHEKEWLLTLRQEINLSIQKNS